MSEDLDDLTEYVMLSLEAPEEARATIRGLAAYFLKETYEKPPKPLRRDLLIEARYRDELRRHQEAITDPDTIVKIAECLLTIFRRLLPEPVKGPVFGTVPVQYDAKVVEDIIYDIARIEPLLPKLRAQLNKNATDERHNFTVPTKDRSFSLEKSLKGTPLLPLFDMQLPFSIGRKALGAHGALFAPTDFGKTRTLEHFAVTLLNSDNPPAMFIIDNKGALLRNLGKLEIFTTKLKDKLVIIDPEDPQPPALNLMRMPGITKQKQLQLFFYIVDAFDQGFTTRQGTMVAYLFELLSKIPDATLDTLRQVLMDRPAKGDAPKYKRYIDTLDEAARDYFYHRFYGTTGPVRATIEQVSERIYTLLRDNQAFKTMFTAPNNTFDAWDIMQNGKICIVNASPNSLGDIGASVLGRYVIAQCTAAALRREKIPEEKRKLALILCDEAKSVLDGQAAFVLSDTRQFRLSLFLASQIPHHIAEEVRKELNTNTSIKMLGEVEHRVRLLWAPDMHTSADFIAGMRSYDRDRVEWATYVRGQTRQGAVKLTVPMTTAFKQPKMSDEQYAALLAANRAKYGAKKPDAQSLPEEASGENGGADPKSNTGKRTYLDSEY